jgi:type II secretory ATPase GspE/PulE/Tfp pilus assembly ATPase PilB-like protein/CheY-like chemotaxis protein
MSVMRQPTSTAATPATPPKGLRVSAEWLRGTISGLLSDEQIATMAAVDDHPWTTVLRRQWATNDAILKALSERFRMRVANLAQVSPRALEAVTEALARRFQILPLAISDSTVDIATSNPFDLDCERTLGFMLGRNVRGSLASPDDIARRLDELYGEGKAIEKLMDEDFEDVAEPEPVREESMDPVDGTGGVDRPIIRLVDRIVAKAIQRRSSDIHLEPEENGVMVRYRIDGVLQNDSLIPRTLALPLVARVKIMARLDIADRLRPQDGRARVTIAAGAVDLRISTLPAALGEKVVIRILDTRQTVLALDALGLSRDDATRIESLLEAREGLVCVTGPTGSGKTTTLYSIVRHIQRRGVNIVTVEDPVEYRLQGIVQVQVNDKTGLTFPAALRSILRQDPDVILIGEIRDRDTAQIAIQAALTGHLVLTTLHTIDAASAIVRLSDVGVAAYKTAAALKGVIAQRLMRRLCVHCRVPEPGALPIAVRNLLGDAGAFRATGCNECSQTGFRGRLAIAEVLVCDAEIERRITAGESTQRLYESACMNGMHSLWDSALAHVRRGVTSVEELLRVVETPPRNAGHVPEVGLSDHVVPDPPAEPFQGFAISDRRSVTPLLQVFEGGAFDLLEDYSDRPPRRSVLVARHAADARRVVRELMEANGFDVIEAADGASALGVIDRTTPDAVVLDFTLQDADGSSVLARLRTRSGTKAIPVLVLAHDGSDDAEVRALESGADDVHTGPLRPRVLVARINALIQKRETRRN